MDRAIGVPNQAMETRPTILLNFRRPKQHKTEKKLIARYHYKEFN